MKYAAPRAKGLRCDIGIVWDTLKPSMFRPERSVIATMLTMTGTCCVLMLVTSSCSKAPVLQTKRSALTANQCAPGTIARRMQAARESILWCRRGDGVDEVNVVGRYNDGRPKVAFALRNGKPHGTYRAWHRNGRRAIRQQCEDGEPWVKNRLAKHGPSTLHCRRMYNFMQS